MSDVINTQWPYDGPHSDVSVLSAADALPALLRYLNNATGPGNMSATLEQAATTDYLLDRVHAAVCGLDQLFRQTADCLRRQAASSSLYDDRHDRPGARTATEAAELLIAARGAAAQLAIAVEAAMVRTIHLGNDVSEDGERP